MYRGYVPPKEVTDPSPPIEATNKGLKKPLVLYGLIILLLGLLITSWGIFFIFISSKNPQLKVGGNFVNDPANITDTNSQELVRQEIENSITSASIDQNGKMAVELESVKNAVQGTDYSSIYSKAIGSANDAKIRADMTAIATTLVILMNEDGLPDNFPKAPRCIGTSTSCFDLYKYIVPEYIDKPYLNPNGGTVENSKYFVGLAEDGVYSVVLQSTGADGNIIEVKK